MSEKTAGELLQEKLFYKPKNVCEELSAEQIAEMDEYCEEYKKFLDEAKTEREAVRYAVKWMERSGFEPFDPKKKYAPGSKIYYNNRGKALCAAVIGAQPLEKGVRILASHIDSPRLDMKPRPLYESDGIGYLKTHYYGGIRKYQWVALPLALHGVIALRDGTVVDVNIGEDEKDPLFVITDLLPHLAAEQNKRTLPEGIKGEELNILIGSRPFKDDKASEKVKLNIAHILYQKYGVTEEDLLSAELCAVPAMAARDIGLDRSMIGSYGHDDRVCAYTSLTAAMSVQSPATTWVLVLADKEEIGSVGNTGLCSSYLEYFIRDLAKGAGADGNEVLSHSTCLSADVNAAFDPTFPDVFDKRNSCYAGCGVVVTKYTGSRGKGGTSDASAEFMASIRRVLDDAHVIWQTGNLGKIDAGGGGTVAMYVAQMNVDVVDIGVPVLAMHSPYEVVSKADVYCTHKAFEAFIRA